MTTTHDPEGYRQGKTDGYQKGKEEGYRQGLQASREARRAAAAAPPLGEISLRWRALGCAEQIGGCLGERIVLCDHEMSCLKETSHREIWKLLIKRGGRTEPLILQVFKAPITGSDLVELNMYRYAAQLLEGLMPTIYMIDEQPDSGNVWVFMEYVAPLKGKLIFTPDHFVRIVPTLARLHARAHKERVCERWPLLPEWLPNDQSERSAAERQRVNGEMLVNLEQAMTQPVLAERLKGSYDMLVKVLQQGPDYFPELLQAGQSMTHNDLQPTAIGCMDISEADWRIKLLSWKNVRLAPCWFDLFNLVGIFFAYRKDWRKDEEAVIERCSLLYARQMEEHGIVFTEEPLRLYKMAYVKRVLERNLHLQLQWSVDGTKPAYLLETYIERVEQWGNELGLLH